jgi:hypothetical protein
VTCTGLAQSASFQDFCNNSLIVLLHRPKDCARINIKHLDEPIVPTSNDKLAILSDLSTACRVLEPSDVLHDLASLWRIDQDPRRCCDCESVRFRGREVDRCDGMVVLDEERMPERVKEPCVRVFARHYPWRLSQWLSG